MFINKIEGYRNFIKITAVIIIWLLGVYTVSSFRFFSEFEIMKAIDESEFKEERMGALATITINLTDDKGDRKRDMAFDMGDLPPQAVGKEYSPKTLLMYSYLAEFIVFNSTMIFILVLTLVFLKNIYFESTPFILKNAKLLKIMSYIVLVYGVLGRSVIMGLIFKWVFDTEWLGVRIKDADWLTMVFGVILLMISVAFGYGMYLQEEYDDTV